MYKPYISAIPVLGLYPLEMILTFTVLLWGHSLEGEFREASEGSKFSTF